MDKTHERTARFLALAAALVAASGCDVNVDANNNVPDNGWQGRIRIDIPFFARSSSVSASSVSFDQIALAFSGHQTLIHDGSGAATLSLYDGSQLLAARSFGDVLQNGIAAPSDASAVEAWVGLYPDTTAYEVEIDDISTTDNAGAGTSGLTMSAVYDGDELASATSTWKRNVCTSFPCQVDVPIE